MKQFGKILKFELRNYLTNKVFIGVTLVIILLMGIVMSLPRFISEDDVTSDDTHTPEDRPIMLISADSKISDVVCDVFESAFPSYKIVLTSGDIKSTEEAITSKNATCAFVIDSLTSFTYLVNDLSMYDTNADTARAAMTEIYRTVAMLEGGLSPEAVNDILSVQITAKTHLLGKDQMQNFFYTYIMIFALYMVILLYGQMVATGVATEKSSRAMELLITSARPVPMMFGKVLAACTAGFTQLLAIFGSALLFYRINKEYVDETGILSMVFNIPLYLLVYMLIFFVLGFLIYAFLFGAIGSTASKLEDISNSVMPITMLYIVAFIIVISALASGTVDTTLMKICSYIPFTSPMAMFTRIAMSSPALYEIILSIVILAVSVILVGIISARIYRVGVLMYGKPPKIKELIKAVRSDSRKNR